MNACADAALGALARAARTAGSLVWRAVPTSEAFTQSAYDGVPTAVAAAGASGVPVGAAAAAPPARPRDLLADVWRSVARLFRWVPPPDAFAQAAYDVAAPPHGSGQGAGGGAAGAGT